MLDYVLPADDRFIETGITRCMVNRAVPAWNEGLAIARARSAWKLATDLWAKDILAQAYACASGYAVKIDSSGVRNGYDYR